MRGSSAICGPEAEKVGCQLTPWTPWFRGPWWSIYIFDRLTANRLILIKILLTADYRIEMLYANMTGDINQK